MTILSFSISMDYGYMNLFYTRNTFKMKLQMYKSFQLFHSKHTHWSPKKGSPMILDTSGSKPLANSFTSNNSMSENITQLYCLSSMFYRFFMFRLYNVKSNQYIFVSLNYLQLYLLLELYMFSLHKWYSSCFSFNIKILGSNIAFTNYNKSRIPL